MAELTVNGVDITVSDSFLKMSPQDQDAFVKSKIVPSAEFKAAQKAGPKAEAPEDDRPGPWSEVGKAFNPLEIAREVGRTASEGLEKVEALGGRGAKGPIEGPLTTASGVLGAGEIVGSPIIGAARNIGGHLMTAAEMAAGRGLSALAGRDLTTQEDPAKMYDVARGDIDLATMAARPGGMPVRSAPLLPGVARGPGEMRATATPYTSWLDPKPIAPVAPAAAPQPSLQNLANVYEEAGLRDVPRALTGSPIQQQGAQTLSRLPVLGGSQIAKAVENVPVQMAARRGEIAGELGAQRLPANVGADIRATLKGQATAEAAAAKAQAEAADAAARAQYEGTIAQRTQATADLEAQSARETGQQIGPAPTTTDTGYHTIDAVRDAHHEAVTRKNALYADAGARQGTIYDQAVGNLHGVVQNELRGGGQRSRVALGPDVTPRATEMFNAVRDFTAWGRNRRAAAEAEAVANYRAQRGYPEGYQLPPAEHAQAIAGARRTGATLADFEDFRKDLGAIYNNIDPIAKPADARAANRIMRGVDNFQERAMAGRHYEGDLEALPAIRRARASNRDLMQRFGYNHNFDEDKVLQKIIRGDRTDHIGPNDVANLIGKAPDKAGRVLDRIFGATGHNPALRQNIKGSLYREAARAVDEGGAPRKPEAIAKSLTQLVGGKKEGLANRLYTPQDIALINRHAAALRTAERARARTGEIAKTTEPVPTKVEPGPSERLYKSVVGGKIGDEALVQRIEGFMSSRKSPTDIRKLADVLKALPEDLKGNMLNLFINKIGAGADGAFSAKQFTDQWTSHTPPAVKHLLTGGDAKHTKALDNLAAAAKQFDLVHKRFGNVSGTGQTTNLFSLAKGAVTTVATAAATGSLIAPAAMVGGWLGAVGVSKFLATPAGASSAAKFARQMAKLQANPTVGQAAAAQMAARNLRNTAASQGLPVNTNPQGP